MRLSSSIVIIEPRCEGCGSEMLQRRDGRLMLILLSLDFQSEGIDAAKVSFHGGSIGI
jgi:hypothetical protein